MKYRVTYGTLAAPQTLDVVAADVRVDDEILTLVNDAGVVIGAFAAGIWLFVQVTA